MTTQDWPAPRPFRLVRDRDETGVSGVGVVAYGCQFPDGSCVLRWDTVVTSTVFYAGVDDLLAIHGHDGATRIEWQDVPPVTIAVERMRVFERRNAALLSLVAALDGLLACYRTGMRPTGALLDKIGRLRAAAGTP